MAHMTVSIIGLGSFGCFMAELFAQNPMMHVIGYDTRSDIATPPRLTRAASLQEAARAHIIVLAVPLQAYDKLLPSLAAHITPQTLIIDVCSVKLRPAELLAAHLPQHQNILLTHPLFGPQSAAQSTAGHKLIVCDGHGVLADQVLAFCQQHLRLKIIRMSADEHDQAMAQVHALTFFVARGLRALDLPPVACETPSYRELLDLVKLDAAHSKELYETVAFGNPYASAMRTRFIEQLQALDSPETT